MNRPMSTRSLGLSDPLQAYLLTETLREPPVLARLREETARLPEGRMQISPEQGQFMALLAELVGARRALELGVFTGYSSTAVALALPPGGKLVACDVNEEWTRVAQRVWVEAGVRDRVELRLGPALGTLDALLGAGQAGSFDLAFVDADKQEYPDYYERCLSLLRPGGLLAFDNALSNGRVADPAMKEPWLEAIRSVNRRARDDPRVTAALVPIGDGMLLARKR
jgi:predicted O-methyltransferase YrrM